MSWTKTQKFLAVKGCKEAGITEEMRRDMILRNFPSAHHGGKITSASPRLTHSDFEAFMAIVEGYAGGKILSFGERYWDKASVNHLARLRFRVRRIAAALEAAGCLAPEGLGLAGWIEKRVTGGVRSTLEQLNFHNLQALILGLEAYARQRSVMIEPAKAEPVAQG